MGELLVESLVRTVVVSVVVADMRHNMDWPMPVEVVADLAPRRDAGDYMTDLEMDSSFLRLSGICFTAY